jgi:hypothetical protein
MVNERAIAERIAARGLQVNRKDKDMMSDTGGTSKGRDKKTPMKPPREDLKNRWRTKDKPLKERERDVDKNPDKGIDKDIRASIHTFLNLPEPTYGDSVWGALVNIISEERGISEKAFTDRDAVGLEARQVIAERIDLVDECEREGARPELCAEILYGVIMVNSTPSQFFDIRASFRDTVVMAKRELARFPDTFMSLLGRMRGI